MLRFPRTTAAIVALVCVSCGTTAGSSISPQAVDTEQPTASTEQGQSADTLPPDTSTQNDPSTTEEPPIGPKGMRVFESDASYRATYFKGLEMIEFQIDDVHGILRTGSLGVGDDGQQKPIGMLVVEPDPSATWKTPIEIMVPECLSAVEFTDDYVTDLQRIRVSCVDTGSVFLVNLPAGSVDAEG